MRNTLYEFHLLKDNLYSKQYFREKTTQELKQKMEFEKLYPRHRICTLHVRDRKGKMGYMPRLYR